ncbi:SIMPL domain-containing protein [Brevundimonas sp.]|uniref:SIMPL domain-containing protein n=1 Tax=Brevundimonas sp. TaxID=1871086 RepID=UPI002D361275|nr:SIMPL domain-containing protein [Brevundimonas sp.]HYC99446.1 SIMPL domain-containing protein [Brevundimonas sp.]
MRRLTALLLTAAVAGPATLAPALALAQTPPASVGDRYVPAPWWMRDPVIASVGYVRTEIPANRAAFSATFRSIDRSAADAARKAADQVRALSLALAAYGVEAVRVETTLSTQPLYDQYRDENGVLRDNARSDQIERYQSEATVSVTVRDVAVLERVYATVIASQPTSTSPVYFNLEPENATKTWLQGEAVKDAARRAREAASNAGASLGGVRVIDPTGRACETDVLAGWPSYASGAEHATDVDASEFVVTASRARAPSAPPAPPPPPPVAGGAPSEAQIESARLALQPPLRELTDRACVVYALN